MIWSVGLRGLNDYAYPNCKETDPGPQGCGEIISQAVANQTQLLVEATGTRFLNSNIAPLIFKMACKQNLDLRCVLAPAP